MTCGRPRRPVGTLAQMRQVLARRIARSREQPDYGLWALELRTTGQVIGAVLLSPLPGADAPVEIGWDLNPDHWGAGYATEGRPRRDRPRLRPGPASLRSSPTRTGRPPGQADAGQRQGRRRPRQHQVPAS